MRIFSSSSERAEFCKAERQLKFYFPARLRFLDPRTESWWSKFRKAQRQTLSLEMFDLLPSTKIILYFDYFADAFKTKFSTNCIVG